MKRFGQLLLYLSILAFMMGCNRSPESRNGNHDPQKEGYLLVKDVMKKANKYSKTSIDSAYPYYSKAIVIANEYDLEEVKPEIYYYLAIIYRDVTDFKMAAIYLDSSIRISSKQGDNLWLSNAYNALGNLKFDLLDSSNAKLYFDSAFNIGKRNSLNEQTGVALASLSKFGKDVNDQVTALRTAGELLKAAPGSEEQLGMIYVNLGLHLSDPDSAIHYFQSAINIATLVNSPEVLITAYNNMAYSYLEKNDNRKAEECLKTYAIPAAEKFQNFDWLSNLYDTYADVSLAKRNISEAFRYERLALETRGKGDEKKAIGQVRLLSALLDVKNKELLIQTRDNEILQKEAKLRTILFWGPMGFMSMIVGFAIFVWLQQREKIRIQSKLIHSAKRLIESEENIKGRVSMELHDLVTPFYTMMIRQIEDAGINNSRVEQEIKSRVIEFTAALRIMSHSLSNTLLEHLSLPELVKSLCNDFRKTASMNIEYSIATDEGFSSEITVHLYRILQELLTNAFKYAKSGKITISLSTDQSTLFLSYYDTGPGFDVNQERKGGIGVGNIKERVRLINGRVALTSGPGAGTEWNIAVPLKKK